MATLLEKKKEASRLLYVKKKIRKMRDYVHCRLGSFIKFANI